VKLIFLLGLVLVKVEGCKIEVDFVEQSGITDLIEDKIWVACSRFSLECLDWNIGIGLKRVNSVNSFPSILPSTNINITISISIYSAQRCSPD